MTLRPDCDLITVTDSVGSFLCHRGATFSSVVYDFQNFFLSSLAKVELRNGPAGALTNGDAAHPEFIQGHLLQGRKGYTPNGHIADALASYGYTGGNVWEFGLAGTTASVCDTTTGAWDVGPPTHQSSTGLPLGDYGVPAGDLGLGGVKDKGHISLWAAKQEWLQDPAHVGHPYRDWTLCDATQFPPTGKAVWLVTCGYNRVFDATQSGARIVDPYTGLVDPDGAVAAAYDDELVATGDAGAIFRLFSRGYMLNPDLEIIWISYLNFCGDDPRTTPSRRFNFPVRTQAAYRPSAANQVPNYAPADWLTWDNGPTEDWWDSFHEWPGATIEHHPHSHTPNPPDPGYAVDTPFSMPELEFPGGPLATTFPWNLTPDLIGFFRSLLGWIQFTSTRDATYPWVADYWAHFIADQQGGQRHHQSHSNGGDATNTEQSINHRVGFLSFVLTDAWHVDNDRWSGYGVPDLLGVPAWANRRWADVYNQAHGYLADQASINGAVVFSSGVLIDMHRLLTTLVKDINSTTLAAVARDMIRPRMDACAAHFNAAGRKMTVIHCWDAIDGDGSFDPAVKVGDLTDFMDGVHCTADGSWKWALFVALAILQRSFTLQIPLFEVANGVSTATCVPSVIPAAHFESDGEGAAQVGPSLIIGARARSGGEGAAYCIIPTGREHLVTFTGCRDDTLAVGERPVLAATGARDQTVLVGPACPEESA